MASRPEDLCLKAGELRTLPMKCTSNTRNPSATIPYVGTTWILSNQPQSLQRLPADAQSRITEQLGTRTCSAGHPIQVTSAYLRLMPPGAICCTLQFERREHNELHIQDPSFAKCVGQVIAASVGAASSAAQVADSAAIQAIRQRHRGGWYLKVSADEVRGLRSMLDASLKRTHDEIDQPTCRPSVLDNALVLWPSYILSLNSGPPATLTPDCGIDLHELLTQCCETSAQDYTQDARFVQQLVAQVHNGLVALHDLELVHGDVKKENILVQNLHTWKEQDPIDVKLIDFEGVCRVDASAGMGIIKGRSDDDFVGSLSSMSADRLRDDCCRPSKQDDRYALFVLMYNMLHKMDFFYMEHVTMEIPIAENRAPLRTINTGLSCTSSRTAGCRKTVQSVKRAVETALQQPVGVVKCTSLHIRNVRKNNADGCDVLRCSMGFDGVAIAALLDQPSLLQQLATTIVREVCPPNSSDVPVKASYSAAPALRCMWDGIRPRCGEAMTQERRGYAAEMLDQHVPGVCRAVRCMMKARDFDPTWQDAMGGFAGQPDTASASASRLLREKYRTK